MHSQQSCYPNFWICAIAYVPTLTILIHWLTWKVTTNGTRREKGRGEEDSEWRHKYFGPYHLLGEMLKEFLALSFGLNHPFISWVSGEWTSRWIITLSYHSVFQMNKIRQNKDSLGINNTQRRNYYIIQTMQSLLFS